jgi:penicillin-binding protein, 1A family
MGSNRRDRSPDKPKPRRKKKRWTFRRVFTMLFVLAAAAAFSAMVVYLYVLISGENMLQRNIAALERLPEASVIYDSEGNEVYRLYRENRDMVKLDEMPELLLRAFVATEDRRFYEHSGIDLISIGRALVTDLMHGSFVQGGSTITQQLAKNLFLSSDKTLLRKATEASMALALENNFSKDDILELYLNTIFFGQRAYGVKSAAQVYFGKDNLHDLELWEIATLAGIPKAPSRYNPISDPELSKQRRAVVLRLMYEQGIITEQEMEAAAAVDYQRPAAGNGNDSVNMPFIDYVLEEVREKTGLTEEQLLLGGYHIRTSLNQQAQRAMAEALDNPEWYPKDGPKQKVQSAMVILDHQKGEILAIYGGRDYAPRGLNRALAKRQPGSSFKPIAVYAPALETGKWTVHSRLKDERMSFGDYTPRNYDGKYRGEVTMREAVRDSINVPAVWLLSQIGVDKGIEFARRAGVELSADDRNLAIALGGLTVGASPLEMAQAYAAFANQGTWVQAHAVLRIEDTNGKLYYEHKPVTRELMSPENAWYMTEMLQEAVRNGTGRNARMDRPSAGKTGTAQYGDTGGNRDVWFVGYTPEWTAAVWMGFDNTDDDHYLTSGSGTPAKLFAEVMSAALKGREKTSFVKPAGVKDAPKAPKPVKDLAAVYDEEDGGVNLTWSEAGKNLLYLLYRKEAGASDAALLDTVTNTTVKDWTVESGKTYQYYVVVRDPDTGLESEPSNIAEAAVPSLKEPLEPPFDNEDGWPNGGGWNEGEGEEPGWDDDMGGGRNGGHGGGEEDGENGGGDEPDTPRDGDFGGGNGEWLPELPELPELEEPSGNDEGVALDGGTNGAESGRKNGRPGHAVGKKPPKWDESGR